MEDNQLKDALSAVEKECLEVVDFRKNEIYSIGEYLTILRHFIHEAENTWMEDKKQLESLNIIRTIGAECVLCLRDNGVIFPGI